MPSALIFQTELEIPLVTPRSALVFWAELEIPLLGVPSPPYLGGIGNAPNDVEGAFSGRTGALPSRGGSDKFNFLQWNWKLGNIVGDKEWNEWNTNKKRNQQNRLDKKLEEDITLGHQQIVRQRESDDMARRLDRQVELARWRINRIRNGKSMSHITHKLEIKNATIENNRMKKDQHLLVEDALALQRKIKMAKVRAAKRRK